MRKITAFGTLVLVSSLPFLAMTACKSGEDARCSYEIDAEYFSEGRLDGSMKVTVPNRTDGVFEAIPFALYGNAFSEGVETPPVSDLFSSACYYGGESYGGMEIKEVTGGSDWSVGGQDNGVLTVSLQEPLYPDESVTLTVRYSLTLASVNHRLGIGESCINLSYFYPMLFAQKEGGFYEYAPAQYGEPFVLECADFKISLTVPEGLTVAGGGKLEEVRENGKTRYRCEAERVRDAAFVLGNFEVLSEERDGVQIDYYYYADEAPNETLAAACDAVATFSELFGNYPYARYAVAEADIFFGGMEYGGFATIASSLRSEDRAEVVAHETAHQWWYASVGSDQAGCAWQDEGLAEYSVALFFEKNPAYGGDYRERIATSESAYRNYFSVKSQLSKEVDTRMSRPLSEYSGDYEYRILAYDKGVVLFDRLRDTMGERRFFSALKGYAEKYAGRVATESDFIACFSSEEELVLSFTEGRCVI